jgi:hypothetical protein
MQTHANAAINVQTCATKGSSLLSRQSVQLVLYRLTNMAKTPTSTVPTEILVKIFSYLNQRDRHIAVAQVCKFWLYVVRQYLSDDIVVSYRGGGNLNCDWKLVAEYSWHSVKRLYLIGSAPTIHRIATKVRTCCPNIAISYRVWDTVWYHGSPGPTDKTCMTPYQDSVWPRNFYG